MQVFIPFNTPSSKNSKQWTGKFLIPSKTTQNYIKQTKQVWKQFAEDFKEAFDSLPKPVIIKFKFFRDSKRKFDYVNPLQTVQDLMVTNSWIPDDNADEILPAFEPYEYNKDNPGVLITIDETATRLLNGRYEQF